MISQTMQHEQKVIRRDEKTMDKIDLMEGIQIVDDTVVRTGVTVSDLMHAASNGYAMIVRYVLAAGIDVNGRDEFGRTALMVAATQEVHDILIDAGATCDILPAFARSELRRGRLRRRRKDFDGH